MGAVLLGLLAAAGLALAWHRRAWALAGLLLLLPFDLAWEMGGFTVYTNEAYLTGVALGMAVWLARRAPAREAALRYLWPFGVFLGAVLLSLAAAEDPVAGVKQSLRWGEFMVALLLARYAVENRAQFYRILGVLFVSGLAASAVGLYQYFSGHAPEAGLDAMSRITGVVRAQGTFGHANQFAGFLILLLPLAFELFLENEHLRWQLVMGLVTLALGLALAATYSRGGWLSAMLATGLVLVYYIPRNLVRSSVLFGVFIILIFVLPTSLTKLNTRLTSLVQAKHDTAVTGRLFYQKFAWSLIRRRPWLGYGAGNYGRELQRHADEVGGDMIYLDKHIHNLYSQIALETGGVGLAAWLLFLGVYVGRYLRGFLSIRGDRRRAMVVAMLAAVFAFLFHNNFDVLIIYARGVHFAVVLSLGLAFVAFAGRAEETSADAVPV